MADEAQRPNDTAGWLIWAWGVGGVLLLLSQAIWRLSPQAAGIFDGTLTPTQWGIAALWTMFMLYSEAWRGFHKQFSPRVVARALGIASDRRPWLVIFAPIASMGLIHATRRRHIVSRSLLAGIILLILLVRALPHPWRGIVDLGVVLGLAVGMLSLLGFAVAAVAGAPPTVPAEFPERGPRSGPQEAGGGPPGVLSARARPARATPSTAPDPPAPPPRP
ncbi:MAG TPA: hypothetical protein ENK18_10210 [Deltaproteobacteria bacterium]|nr:hypothetical protein [Deltaproteobacteria bacterium]